MPFTEIFTFSFSSFSRDKAQVFVKHYRETLANYLHSTEKLSFLDFEKDHFSTFFGSIIMLCSFCAKIAAL